MVWPDMGFPTRYVLARYVSATACTLGGRVRPDSKEGWPPTSVLSLVRFRIHGPSTARSLQR